MRDIRPGIPRSSPSLFSFNSGHEIELRKVLLILSALLLMDSDSQAVTISVPNQINTLAAAIDAATSNDVIQITNGITYHEDLIIPQAKSGITLEGVGAPPTIRPLHTANNRSPLKVFMGLVGSPGAADCAGFIVEGNGTTLRNLVIADPTAGAEDPISPLGISQSLTVFGSDVTIEDCTIVSDSGSEEHAGLLAMGGDWPTLDTQFAMAFLGTPFSTAGYTTPDPVNGLTITNCGFLSDGDGENSSAFASFDLAVVVADISLGIDLGALHGTGWSVAGCDFSGLDNTWKTACGVFLRCLGRLLK